MGTVTLGCEVWRLAVHLVGSSWKQAPCIPTESVTAELSGLRDGCLLSMVGGGVGGPQAQRGEIAGHLLA